MLARDRMGEKPLYYGYVNNTFSFASELKCLEKIIHIDLLLDHSALNEFIRRGFITGSRTIYDKIYKLCPGEMVCIDSDLNIKKQCFYWDNKDAILSGKELYTALSLRDASSQLEWRLTDTVSK